MTDLRQKIEDILPKTIQDRWTFDDYYRTRQAILALILSEKKALAAELRESMDKLDSPLANDLQTEHIAGCADCDHAGALVGVREAIFAFDARLAEMEKQI